MHFEDLQEPGRMIGRYLIASLQKTIACPKSAHFVSVQGALPWLRAVIEKQMIRQGTKFDVISRLTP